MGYEIVIGDKHLSESKKGREKSRYKVNNLRLPDL